MQKIIKMPPKKRGCKKAFLKFGFMSVIEKSQCVICFKVLTQENMKPSKLKQHFESFHDKLAGKLFHYFRQKSEFLGECVQNKAVLKASYRIAFCIALAKKSHTIGEKLIKFCLIKATTLVLGEKKPNKLKEILLSNDTVKKRISKMSQDILLQVVDEVRFSLLFSLQLDESTDPVPDCWFTLATSLKTM